MNSPASNQYSIILPVKNGGEYIKECVNSILSQSVPDFNLIILDSGSTDGTIQWINSLNNPRIIIYLSEKPLTIEENWGRIKTIARKEWMTIIGHDDILQADYLAVIDELINKHPKASLYQTHFKLIDAKGNLLRQCKPMAEIQSANDLLKGILANSINIYGTGFMMRTIDYNATGGIPMYPNLLSADYVLWLELSSIAYLAVSSENCFSYRINQSTTAITKDAVYISALKLFINFLIKSKDRFSPAEDKNSYIKKILSFYCKRVSRRLIKVSKEERDNLSVGMFLKECKAYSKTLLDKNETFNPTTIPSVWVAKMIDSTATGRKLFLFIKRIFPNPIL